MNKKAEIEIMLRKASNSAQEAWLNYLKATIAEVGTCKLESPNETGMGYDIYTQDESHEYVYHMFFDAVESLDYHDELVFMFHVQNGDGLFEDDQWVFDHDFADMAWQELFDGIVWPDE